jgi:hypothetical protein
VGKVGTGLNLTGRKEKKGDVEETDRGENSGGGNRRKTKEINMAIYITANLEVARRFDMPMTSRVKLSACLSVCLCVVCMATCGGCREVGPQTIRRWNRSSLPFVAHCVLCMYLQRLVGGARC